MSDKNKFFDVRFLHLRLFPFSTDDPTFESSYRARHVCWIHRHSLHFGFLIPFTLLALFNLISFTLIMNKIGCKKTKVSNGNVLASNSKRNKSLETCFSDPINRSKADKPRKRHYCFFGLCHDGFDMGVRIPASVCRKHFVSNYNVVDFHRAQFISGIEPLTCMYQKFITQ